MIKFSVIIPTYLRTEALYQCLKRLQNGYQTLNANQYEVIVTDDGRKPNMEFEINSIFPHVKYYLGNQAGPAANRNNGARYAIGNWLLFTDDDCLPDASWLNSYANAISKNPDIRAFEGAIIPDDWKLFNNDLAECPVNIKGGCFWSANIMIERNLFFEVGGFDEQFKIAAQEDQDLQKKILHQTCIKFIPEAIVIHPVRIGSLSSRIKRIAVTTINWHKYYRKDHDLGNTIIKGWKSQALALRASLVHLRGKAAVYHFFYFLSVFPIIIYAELCNEARVKK